MSDFFGFRQKGAGVPRGVDSEATDADPSEQSGFAANIGVPVWRQFVNNEGFQEGNKEAIQAEKDYQNRVARENASERRSGGSWASRDGKLLRNRGKGLVDEIDPEQLANDPEVGTLARKTLWEREIGAARKVASDSSFQLKDPSFHAQKLSDKMREDALLERDILDPSDPRRGDLESRIAADDEYRKRKAELAQQSFDSESRAREIESMDPDSWFQSRRQPTNEDRRAAMVAETQAKRAETQSADNSAAEELAEIEAKLAQGVKGPEVEALQARRAEIAAARGVIAEKANQAEAPAKQAQAEAKEFFRFDDTVSGIWDAVKGLGVTAPAAFYQLLEGLDRPDQYSDSAKKAFAEADAFNAEMQAKTAANQAAGVSSSVGESFREAGGSLGFSLGSMAAAIPASMVGAKAGAATGAVIGAAAGAPAAGVGAAPGAGVGAGVGALVGGVTAAMAASGTAAYRMAGAQFLNETFNTGLQEYEAVHGAPMPESERKALYDALMPIAKNTALWEAGPEAVGNAFMLGAGKIIFGSTIKKVAAEAAKTIPGLTAKRITAIQAGKIVGSTAERETIEAATKTVGSRFLNTKLGKLTAGLADVPVEITTEAMTQIEQSADQQKGDMVARGQDPSGIQADWSVGGFAEALAEVTPQTLALMGLMGGGATVIKGSFSAIEKLKPTSDPSDVEQAVPAVNAAIAATNPESAPATPEEIKQALMISNPAEGAEGLAASVEIERELATISMQDNEALVAANEALEAAKATGDTNAVKIAEEAKASVQGRAEGVRAVLKIAGGQGLGSLSKGELASIGFNRDEKGKITPMSETELAAVGLKDLQVTLGDDGSLVLMDSMLDRIEAASPLARSRVKMKEGEALIKASERAQKLANRPVWSVTARDGSVVDVQADTAEEAEREVAGSGVTVQPGSAVPKGEPADESAPAATPAAVPTAPPLSVEGLQARPTTELYDEELRLKETLRNSVTDPAGQEVAKLAQEGLDRVRGEIARRKADPNFVEPVAATPAATPKDPVEQTVKAAKARLAKIAKQSPEIAAALTTGPAQANATTISIDPEAIITEALERGLTAKEALARFNAILNEEIKHLSQKRAAIAKWTELNQPGEFAEWYQSYYGGRWQVEFVANGKADVVRTLYAKGNPETEAYWDSMPDADKFMEATRMMMQRREGSTVTEVTKLWFDISKELLEDLRAMLRKLRDMVKQIDATPALKADLEYFENELRNVLKNQSRARTPKADSKKPAQSKPGDGTGSKDKLGGSTDSDGGIVPTGGEGVGSPLSKGDEVEFDAHNGRPAGTGVVRIANDKVVSVKVASGESFLVPVGKVRLVVNETPVGEKQTPLSSTDETQAPTADIEKFVNAYSNYHLARIAREAKNGKQRPEYYDQQREEWTPDKVRERVMEFLQVIDNKDVATLVRYNNGQFDGFWKIFGLRTGMVPPKTQTGIADVIRSYVGDDAYEENQKAIEDAQAKKDAESKAKNEKYRIEGLKADAERSMVNHEGKDMNGREFADTLLADGWRVENVSNGPVPRYQLSKGGRSIKNSKGFGAITAYAREKQKGMPPAKESQPEAAAEGRDTQWEVENMEVLSRRRMQIIEELSQSPPVQNALKNTPQNAGIEVQAQIKKMLGRMAARNTIGPKVRQYFTRLSDNPKWIEALVRDLQKAQSTEVAPEAAAPPALTAAEQQAKDDLADAFDGLIDGLRAAPAPVSYREKPPADRLPQFQKAAQSLIAAGVESPTSLAAFLEKIAPGKLRAYSEFLWRQVDSFLMGEPVATEWTDVYQQLDNTGEKADIPTEEQNNENFEQAKTPPPSVLSDDRPQTGQGLESGTGKPAVDSESGGKDNSAGTQGKLPNDGKGAGTGGNSGTVGGNASRPGVGSQTSKTGRGDDAERGGESSADGIDPVQPGNGSGVAGTESPAGYRLTDPDRIIGAGGPKARFARNKLALETYDTVLSENRNPTKEEQDILAAYIGWGSFGQELFQGTWERPNPKDNFKTESEWLRDHLGQKGWESIRDSILNAHYTDPPHVQALWRIVEHLGFKGGRILEPSMGIGTFFGLMPDIIRAKSSLTGIELDSVVGGMAKMLYPDANIRIMGYEKSATADGFYDLVIGNWPFAREGPSDPRYNSLGLSLHDYFFVKALDQTRAGGLVIGITSNGTMDKKGQNTRRQLARRAELVAAFRFPSGAFDNYAGTKVVTDVLILKKRETPSADIENDGWINTEQRGVGERTFNANEYWSANPQNVLGEMTWGHGTTSGKPGMIVNRQDDYAEALSRIEQSLPKDIFKEVAARENSQAFQNTDAGAGQNSVVWNEGSASTPEGFHIVRGEQLERLDSVFKWRVADKKATEKRSDELKQLIDIRDSVQKLLDAQREGSPNTEAVRKETKDKYDAFVKEHGVIAKSFMVKALAKAEDPMSRTVENLERKEGRKYVPRDILLKDIMRRPVTDAKGSVEDAFAIQRNQSTTLDIEAIADLSGMPIEEVTAKLIALDQIYLTPTGEWESREEYLGGNVRRKLNEAKDALSQGMDMERNIESLEKIQPKDVPYFEIEVQMGASWIPRTNYLEFAAHLLGGNAENIEKDFNLTKVQSGWNFKVNNGNLESGTNGTGTWGTRRLSFSKIFSAAMNGTTVKVWDTDIDGVKHLNDSETQLANTKVDAIREELASWLWSDPTRAGQLGVDYNNVKNSEVVPNRSGSHLRFEGLSLTLGSSEFDLRKHQQDAVWRFIMDGRGVGAHEVGTGKTFTMAALAVEGRRLGVFRKSLLFAHNSNAESVYKDFQSAYPGGKFLFINSLNPEVRENAMRQIATDEWDAVIVTHSLIDRFALREETLMQIAKKEITQLESEIADELESLGQTITDAELNDDKAFNKKMSYVKDSHTAKDLVKARNRIIKRIKDKAAKAHGDNAVFFEDLGVDSIMVDEAHIFKKIALATRKQVKGLNKTESERGWMLGALTDTVKARNNGKGVFLFTGTPLTNNLNEAYNMMKFVMDDAMADVGINGFDDWFNDFAASVTDTEWTTGGTLEPVTRLLSFVNVPELARLAGRYFDVVQAKNMPEFVARESTEGKSPEAIGRPFKTIRSVTAEMTKRQKDHKESVKERYENFQRLDGKAKRQAMLDGVNTPIQLESEGTKAALDMRLLDRHAPDDPNSKVNMMLKNAFEHYIEDDQSTQMIFMEQGFNDYTDSMVAVKDEEGVTRKDAEGKTIKQKRRRRKFNLVRDMVEKLVAQGVKPEEIAVFSNMSLDTIAERPDDILRKVVRPRGKTVSKEDISAMMREGKIRFAIGSTQTMGTGVNAQTHMRAMHHLDAPWTPGEFEQRNGRGHRQGNQWNTVFEYRYYTEGSHDVRRWQVLLNKVKFISRFTEMLVNAGGSDLRVLTGDGADLGETGENVADFEQSLSTAAGDPRIMIRAKLKTDVDKLERKRDSHFQAIARAQEDIRQLRERKARDKDQIARSEEMLQVIAEAREKPFEVKIDGKTFTERAEAETYLAAYPSLTQADNKKEVIDYHGIKVVHEWGSSSWENPSIFYAKIPVKGGKFEKVSLGKLSVASMENNLRGQARALNNLKESFDTIDASIASLQAMTERPFTRDAELDAKKKALQQIEVELSRAPHSPPSWLRQGAPVGSLVYLEDKKAYDVAAHRWDENGWWILVEDKNGMRPVDYRKVFDESEHEMFEEIPFVKPTKVKEYGYARSSDLANSAPPNHSRLDEQDERGRFGVIYYSRPLTDSQIRSFNLTAVKEREQAPEPVDEVEERREIVKPSTPLPLFDSERYRKRDGRLAALRKISERLQAKWDAADELPVNQQETLERINAEIAHIEKQKYQESMRGDAQPLRASPAPLRADSPEWKAMSKEERKGYLKAATAPTAQSSARAAFERNRDKFENAQQQVEAFGSGTAGANPKFANPGSTPAARDTFDITRMIDSAQREVRKDRDTFSRGREYLEKFPDAVEKLLMENAYGENTEPIADYQQHAINLFLDRKAQEAAGDRTKLEELYILATANILNGREQARSLRMRMDRFATPAERAQSAIYDSIFTPNKKVAARAEVMAPKERKEFLAAEGKKRIEQVEKELAKRYGLKIEKILGKNRDLQLKNTQLEKDILKLRNTLERDMIKAIQGGATMADIRRVFGKRGVEQAEAVNNRARQEAFDKIKEMAASGMDRQAIIAAMRDTLKAAPMGGSANGMTDAEIWAMVEADLGLPKVIPKRSLPRLKKAKVESEIETHPLSANWSRPEFSNHMKESKFDTTDRANIMERVEIIRGLAGAVGKIDSLTGDQRAKAEKLLKEIDAILAKYGTNSQEIFEASKGIEDYGFDINDIAQVAAVARTINALDADIIDKATEYLYFSMLSGLQTMIVNATAILPAAWESTVGRGVNMAINRFVKDPMAEQFGEGKYIVRALGPALARAKSNFVASMAAQHPMFDRDVNAMEVDWDKILGGGSHRMIGSIAGRKGDIIRLPMRLLTATDDFNRTLMACAEVGAFAYRMAKMKGFKDGSPEMDKFILAEVNTPGSLSFQLASRKASKAIYTNPLPGQSDPHTNKPVPVNDMGDFVGFLAGKLTSTVAADHDNIFIKTVAAAMRIAFFPFQRTPFNIIRKGVRHTLNPFSLADIALGVVRNAKNEQGKWEWKIKGEGQAAFDRHIHRAELVERMGQQLQGAVLMTALVALASGEGDDDDQDKRFIITGSMPFLPSGRSERDAKMRSGLGPFRMSWRNKDGSERIGLSYGRIEPVATILAATIDTIKSAKRSWRGGGDNYDASMAAMGGLVSQAQDKTFMRGIGDFIGLASSVTEEPDVRDNRKALQFLAGRTAMVVPNIIKQPIRESDGQFRERADSFMQELLYQAVPAGQKPAKVDPYGAEVKKPGVAALRPVDMMDIGGDPVNPIDRMLMRWSDKHPDKAWFPSPIINAEFKHPVTGQNVKMNQAQLTEFRTMAGKRAQALLRIQSVNMDNPTEMDVDRVKAAITKSRSDMKKALRFKFSRQ